MSLKLNTNDGDPSPQNSAAIPARNVSISSAPSEVVPPSETLSQNASQNLTPQGSQRTTHAARRRSQLPVPSNSALEKDLVEARHKVQFLDGECERLKHQVTTLKQDLKKGHANLFDMTSLKNQLAAQVEDLMLEKEETRQQVINASSKHTLEMQEMHVRLMNAQKELEDKNAELVTQENTIMSLRADVERFRQGGGKAAAGRFGRKGQGEGDDDSTHIKAIRLEMANLQLSEQVEKLQVANNDNLIAISNLQQENASLKEDVARMRAFISKAGLVLPMKGEEEEEVELVNAGKDTSAPFLCIEESRAKEQFAIERDALHTLVLEGRALFEELYNAHRVMRRTALDDVERATQLWMGLSRQPSNSPGRSRSPGTGVSPARRPSSPGKGAAGTAPPQQQHPKVYVMPWYNGKGPDMVQSWLANSSNIFSPALVQSLVAHGFTDMQSLSKITEEDLVSMCVTAGVRRKVLSAVEELNRKIAIVQEETDALLRDSYYTGEKHTADGETADAEDGTGKKKRHDRRKKGPYSELTELLSGLQEWFSDAIAAVESQEGAVDRIFTLTSIEPTH